MGGNIGACEVSSRAKSDIIEREMKIYRWRAENASNGIPVIDFRSEFKIKEEEKLRQFLGRYKQKDYLQLYKLRRQLQELQKGGQQIIAFEKYACSLDDFESSLYFEQVVYVLDVLLLAFEQIKRMFSGPIPVNKKCCFVTLKGEVRGWINSNSKSNEVQNGSQLKLFGERQYKQLARAIVEIGEQVAIKQYRSDGLFISMKNFIYNSVLRNDIFYNLRQFMEGYCRTMHSMMAINLSSALRRNSDLKILKFHRRSSSTNCDTFSKRTNSFSCTPVDFSYVSDQRSFLLQKQKDHEVKMSVVASTFASVVGLNQSMVRRDCFGGNELSEKKKPVISRRLSEMSDPKTSRVENNQSKLKASQVIPSTPKPQIAVVEIGWAKEKEANLSINENICQGNQSVDSEEPTLLQGKFLTSKEMTNVMSLSKPRRTNKYKTEKVEKKIVSKQISILDIGCEDGGEQKENDKPKVHFRTFHEVDGSNSSIGPERPWITSKTISKLISGQDDFDSLVHSVGSSSESGAPSSYSGALSGMGRQVHMYKKSKVCEASSG